MKQRNPEAKCANCPYIWEGEEAFMYGVDEVVDVMMTRCTKDQKFVPIRADQFCEAHPEFWQEPKAGLQ